MTPYRSSVSPGDIWLTQPPGSQPPGSLGVASAILKDNWMTDWRSAFVLQRLDV